MSEVKEESLWSKLYNGCKATVDAIKEPLIKNQVQRKFQSVLDDAKSKKIDAECALINERQKLGEVDINKLIASRKLIDDLDIAMDNIKTEYKLLFGKDME